MFPIIGFPIIPLLHAGSDVWNKRAVIFFLVFLCVLTLIAVMPTGAENPGCWQKFVRYTTFNDVKLVTRNTSALKNVDRGRKEKYDTQDLRKM